MLRLVCTSIPRCGVSFGCLTSLAFFVYAKVGSIVMVCKRGLDGCLQLEIDAKGVFTVQLVSLGENGSAEPQGKHRFKIAIRDFNTKTMISFSDQTYMEIDANKVLSQCRKGDSIVFITMDRQLALPHNEVLVK